MAQAKLVNICDPPEEEWSPWRKFFMDLIKTVLGFLVVSFITIAYFDRFDSQLQIHRYVAKLHVDRDSAVIDEFEDASFEFEYVMRRYAREISLNERISQPDLEPFYQRVFQAVLRIQTRFPDGPFAQAENFEKLNQLSSSARAIYENVSGTVAGSPANKDIDVRRAMVAELYDSYFADFGRLRAELSRMLNPMITNRAEELLNSRAE